MLQLRRQQSFITGHVTEEEDDDEEEEGADDEEVEEEDKKEEEKTDTEVAPLRRSLTKGECPMWYELIYLI